MRWSVRDWNEEVGAAEVSDRRHRNCGFASARCFPTFVRGKLWGRMSFGTRALIDRARNPQTSNATVDAARVCALDFGVREYAGPALQGYRMVLAPRTNV